MMNSSDCAKKFQENTLSYIENYLNPFQKWGIITSSKQRIDLIRYSDVNWGVISDHIKKMDYRDFLATPYWKAISAHTKYRARYRCQVCNYGCNLVTHHRNYDIHGQEHAHMHELIVLCRYCHEKFHGREKTSFSQGGGREIIRVVIILFLLIAFVVTLT